MTDWQIVHGSNKPAEFDSTSSSAFVYQRRNAQLKTETDSNGNSYDCWQYEERKLSFEEFYKLKAELLETELTNTQLALAELYEGVILNG